MNQHPLKPFASHFTKGKQDIQTMIKQVIRKELTRKVDKDQITEHEISIENMKIKKKTKETPYSFYNVTKCALENSALTFDILISKSRKREIAVKRQLCMHVLAYKSAKSLKSIGLYYGGRDHSTVIASRDRIDNYLDTDPDFVREYENLMENIEKNRYSKNN